MYIEGGSKNLSTYFVNNSLYEMSLEMTLQIIGWWWQSNSYFQIPNTKLSQKRFKNRKKKNWPSCCGTTNSTSWGNCWIWSSLIQFDLIWSHFLLFVPIFSTLIKFDPIWSNYLIWSNLNQFDPNLILHGWWWHSNSYFQIPNTKLSQKRFKNRKKRNWLSCCSSTRGNCWIWSSLIQFDPIWSSLIQFDEVWYNLIKFDSMGSYLFQFIPLWSSLILFDPVWSNLI